MCQRELFSDFSVGAHWRGPINDESRLIFLESRLDLARFVGALRIHYPLHSFENMIRRLAAAFPNGGTVGIDELISAGLANKGELVKILGGGELEGVKLDVTAHAFTGSAQEKITAAGGSATKLDS